MFPSAMRTLWAMLLLLVSAFGSAQEIRVAAAADLNAALRAIAARFEAKTGNTVKLTFGSSGNFTAQIQNGAPFDVFLSADSEYPKRLEAAGLVEPGSLYEYAIGRLVLWVPKSSKLDSAQGPKVLLDSSVRKIAIANPQHAPYGRAAVAALRSAGLYEKAEAKLVLGENITQAAQFVQTGNAQVGIIALALALAPAMKTEGRYFQLDPKTYPEIRQTAVVLKAAKNKAAALAFLQYLKEDEAQRILQSYGFIRP